MIKRVLEFLVSRNYIEILPIESSFFKYFLFEQPVKMNDEAVRLNYSHLSPFNKSDIVYKNEENILYIWFYEQNFSKAKLLIPESYLIYKYFKERDVIVILEDEIKKIVVIKNGILSSQLAKKELDERFLKLLQKEFSIGKVIRLSSLEYGDILQKAFYKLSLKDIFGFSRFSIDKSFFQNVLEKTALPLLSIVFFVIAIEYGEYFYTKSAISKKTKEYREIKRKNDLIRKKIRDFEEEAKTFVNFKKRHKEGFYKIDILSFIADTSNENNSSFVYTDLEGGNAVVVLKTPNPNKLLNDLLSSSYFPDLRIISSRKERDGNETVRFEGKYSAK